ncbi:MAG: type I restriction endonuclease, partial [Armatimonadota bacterium]|nr:type I restriction endonuclease [Armatimonadota bacterium]
MRELLETIEKAQERIEKYRDQLCQNEMLTRYALIDPILRALGWDTEDPEQVVPEVSTPQGRPDYGLYHNGIALVMVEAKSLGTDLKKAKDDGFKYCWQNKVPYFVVTDGDVWELHDLSKMGGEQIFRVQLSRDNSGDAARKLLALWREAMPKVEIALP